MNSGLIKSVVIIRQSVSVTMAPRNLQYLGLRQIYIVTQEGACAGSEDFVAQVLYPMYP